jgi:hypothetical protein
MMQLTNRDNGWSFVEYEPIHDSSPDTGTNNSGTGHVYGFRESGWNVQRLLCVGLAVFGLQNLGAVEALVIFFFLRFLNLGERCKRVNIEAFLLQFNFYIES